MIKTGDLYTHITTNHLIEITTIDCNWNIVHFYDWQGFIKIGTSSLHVCGTDNILGYMMIKELRKNYRKIGKL